MTTTVTSLWEPFGLRGSPFFQDELRPLGDDEHPATLFVGREAELTRIERRIISDRATRTIVQGEPGVGKTSFVNRLKADLTGTVLTHEHPIRITSETSRTSFLADVLRTLVRIRLTRKPHDKEGDDFWRRTVRLLEGEDIYGGSLSAFGVGAGISRGYVAPQMAPDSLYEHLGEALKRISREFGTTVLLHVNNLENLSHDSTKRTAVLLRDLRDYLMLPGAHWVFVGATGVEDDIFRVYAQVGGIFPEAETLHPLDPLQIETLLSLRYRHLTMHGRALVEPVTPADGARLYSLYRGDLRNFLRLLSDAAERGLGLHGVRPMTAAEVLLYTTAIYERHLRRGLGDTDFEHLARIIAALPVQTGEFRVTDAARLLKLSQAAASKIVVRMEERRVIRRTRTQGRSTYYVPTGEALVGAGVASGILNLPR